MLEKIHFFLEQMRHINMPCQHVAIATSKHQRFYNTFSGISCLSAYAK